MQEDVRSQTEAWDVYDSFLLDERVSFHAEVDPGQNDSALRKLTYNSRSLSQQWPAAYLTAFARVSGLTLVTFDRGLRRMAARDTILLR
jgi:predicted nucleic acid-binding protein